MLDEFIEDRLMDELVIPHVAFPQDTIQRKKILAWHVNSMSDLDVLFASAMSFSYEGFLAGLTLKQIEYFAKNAPKNYKQELAKSIATEYKIKQVFEIAKMMDEDLGDGVVQNQKRMKSVFQYVSDNWAVFQF